MSVSKDVPAQTLCYNNLSFTHDNGKQLDGLEKQWTKCEDTVADEEISTSLIRTSTTFEKSLTGGGLFLAVIAGIFLPFCQGAYSELVNLMINRQDPGNSSTPTVFFLPMFGGGKVSANASQEEQMQVLLKQDALAFTYLDFGGNILLAVIITIAIAMVKYSALNQAHRIRLQLFTAILKHDMAWFDVHASENFSGKMNEQLAWIEDGIGIKLVLFVYFISNIVVAFAFNFYFSWKQTLIVGSILPLTAIVSGLAAKFQSVAGKKELESENMAGAMFTEATSNIRTVLSFSGEEKEMHRFEKQLDISSHYAVRCGIATNLATAFNWMLNVLIMAITYFNGYSLDFTKEPLFVLILVYVNVWLIIMRIVYVPSFLNRLIASVRYSTSIFETIHSKEGINPLANVGSKLSHWVGEIDFNTVQFTYPARPGVKVINGISFSITPGQFVAIIGSSGSGKSTILHLIQRYYDIESGSLLVDGLNIKKLDIQWWRSKIGVVEQEANLFSGTIAENIQFGLLSASMEDVVTAAKKANAHGFISKLPQKYETTIGSKGSTLSGGEKQRIAIARALIRDPKILLLDEPTSALDEVSREIVEAAIQDASKNRTTVMVTHRLSTVRNADWIIVMDSGQIVEQGSHEQLLSKKGVYCTMIKAEKELTDVGSDKMPLVQNGSMKIVEPVSRNIGQLDSKSIEEEDEDEEAKVSLKLILTWSRPEMCFIVIGFLAAIVAGILLPICNILYGDILTAFTQDDIDAAKRTILIYSYGFLAVSISLFLVIFTELTMFTLAREKLSKRLRSQAFFSVLKQELGWFDDVRNHVGAIYSRMSRDVVAIHAINGPGVAMMVQAITMVVVGIGISFYFSWKLTLVTSVCLVPFFCCVLYDNFLSYQDDKLENSFLEDASKIMYEVIQNKTVVTSLGLESYFIEKYMASTKNVHTKWLKACFMRGFCCALGQTGYGFGIGACLLYGCHLMANDNLPYQDVIKVSELVLFGALILATEFVFTPTIPAAKHAAKRMGRLLERTSKIEDGSVKNLPETKCSSKAKFNEVQMSYPTRPNNTVLRSLNLSIEEGKHIAIVGPSGSGKSSILHLLQRLYDPSEGNIYLNSCDIKRLALTTLRNDLGLVSQEPVLFSGTIAENIAYGDNSRNVTMAEIIEAAKAANIHEFITTNLPAGYDTKLGINTQLSGGQKQRIAIARALVRNPKVLLLDEATSALDPEGERAVQQALDKASQGRTTITIAHRIGAVAKADKIVLLVGGKVVENTKIHDKYVACTKL